MHAVFVRQSEIEHFQFDGHCSAWLAVGLQLQPAPVQARRQIAAEINFHPDRLVPLTARLR